MTDLTPAVRPTDLTPAGPGHRVLDLTALPGPFAVVHSLTTLIGVCPNRDRDQQPKTLVLGGAERMRISSQALIRAARTHLRTHTLHSAVHTRLLPAQTARRLQDKGIDTADAIPAAYAVVHGAGITMTPDDPTRTRA
ncbi:type I-E CRISPR-associated protein Cas7/Cse4/CasC, partial [Streptomyces clavuligerus]